MTKEEHHNLEQDFKHATPLLIVCFIVALAVVCCFLFFLRENKYETDRKSFNLGRSYGK